MTDTTRYDFLDWLRVLAIALLLVFHTGMIFVGWGWHVTNAQTIAQLQWPMDIAHRLRMPLLFVIAGAGLWYAARRRTGWEIIGERGWRLLVPLVFGVLVIVPPQVYFERRFQGRWSGSYLDFLIDRVFQFHCYPQGDFAWHHLWFIAYLYLFVWALVPVVVLWRRAQTTLRPGAWLFALALPLGVNEVLLKERFGETHLLISDWYLLVHYLTFTAYGVLLARVPSCWDWLAEHRRASLGVAIASLILVVWLLVSGHIEHGSAEDSLLTNVFTWAALMAFLGHARQHLSWSNPLLRWARDASYPIYILHQTVTVALGFYVVRQPWTPWVKFGVVLAGTVLLCLMAYEFVIRRFGLTRLLFGMKRVDG